MKIYFLLLTASCWGAMAGKGDAAELDFSIFEASARLFTKAEAATLPEHGKADVRAVLKARGFELPEGSNAFYDAVTGRLFLRSTTRDLRQLQRLVQQMDADEPAAASAKQVRMQAICYAVPVSALPDDFGPQSSLDSLPSDQLTIVDRTSLICRGGQRAKVDSRLLAPEAAKPATAPDPDEVTPSAGERYFEYECTISDDSSLIDLNVAWEVRSEKLAPEGQTATFNVATQILAAPGAVVLQELGITEEKEPRLILLSLEFHLLPPPKPEASNPGEDPAK